MSETSRKKPQFPRYRGHSRLTKSGKGGNLNIPPDMMILLTEGLLFKPELVRDGILFKIVDESKIAADDRAVPAWVKKVTPAAPSETSVSEPDTDDEVIHGDEDGDHGVLDAEAQEGEDEPPTDDDSPF